jgi:hypothetical protein
MQLDEELRQRLAEVQCPRCDSTGGFALIGMDWPHFGRVICAESAAPLVEAIRGHSDEGHYVDWLQKPRDIPAARRRRTRLRKVDSLSERCEICLRSSAELTSPTKLDAHHAIEVQDGGSDDDSNRRVYCTDCHALVHWARRALARDLQLPEVAELTPHTEARARTQLNIDVA